MKRLLTLFIMLGGLMAAAPGIISYQVEERYQQVVQAFDSGQLRVVQTNYERGWFGSIATSDLSLEIPTEGNGDQPSSESLNFQLISHISHGPLVSSGAGLAEAVTLIQAEDALLPEGYKADIHTIVNFGGRGKTKITLPATKVSATDERPAISFGGIVGELTFTADMNEVHSDFSMPSFTATQDSFSPLELGPVRLVTNGKRSASGLMMGGGQFSVEQLQAIDPSSDFKILLKKLLLAVSSQEVAGSVSSNVNYHLDGLTVGDDLYGPADLEIQLSQLPADTLVNIQQGIEEINAQQLNETQKGMAVMSVLMGNAPALLKADPKLTIRKLYANTPQGEIKGDLVLQSVGLSWADIANPGAVMSKLVGEANIQIPESLLLTMLEQRMFTQVQQQIQQRRMMGEEVEDPDPAMLAKSIEAQSQQQLEFWLQQQFVVREGESINASIVLSEGLLNVNGKTIPLFGG